MLKVLFLCLFSLTFALDGNEDPALAVLEKWDAEEAKTHSHPGMDAISMNIPPSGPEHDLFVAYRQQRVKDMIANQPDKDPEKVVKDTTDEMEAFIAAAETDPYLKAILTIVLEDEMSDTHPALKRFAAREAKIQKTYPEKIIVRFAMVNKPRIQELKRKQGFKDDEEAGRFYADQLELALLQVEDDPVTMAALDVVVKEEMNPTHPLADQQVMEEAEKDGVPPEIEFVKMVKNHEGPLFAHMKEEGIEDLAEGIESAVGALETQAYAEMALAAETEESIAESEANAYSDGRYERDLDLLDYGTYFFAAVGVAVLAGKAFSMMRSKDNYAIVEHDDDSL